MTIAFFDCSSGLSGDMMLGALVDAGVDVEDLNAQLQTLSTGDKFHLKRHRVQKSNIVATRIEVVFHGLQTEIRRSHVHSDQSGSHQTYCHLYDVVKIIDASRMEAVCKEKTVMIFRRLAEAEATVHETTIDRVHLHEVGALDSIVDVAGTVCALHQLGVERIYSSPIVVGSGTVECAHGTMSVPVPAVTELLRGYPFETGPVQGELCTPTGAALIRALSSGVRREVNMKNTTVGYGAGTRNFELVPNVLRVMIGEEISDTGESGSMATPDTKTGRCR